MPRSLRREAKATLAIIIVAIFFIRVQIVLERQITAAISGTSSQSNKFTAADSSSTSSDQRTEESKEAEKYSIPSKYDPSFIHPGWACSSPSPSRSTNKSAKLIFVHVFKTAGSTFRTFFHSYGEKCGRGVSTIIHCSALSSESLESPNPDDYWEPDCEIKTALSREKEIIATKEKLTRAHLQKHADIVIGHLPVGIHKNLIDDKSGEQITPQYVSFFREPMTKFVSGRLFVHQDKRWTFDEAVEHIKVDIRSRYRKRNYYNGYTKYLSTPHQKEQAKKNKLSQEGWVRMMMQNIIDMHVIVGIVENMGESVGLLQSIIDTDEELTDDFESLVNPNDSGSLVKNKSKLSSSKIVATLKEDGEIWNMLNEVLKYEFELYDFAVQVHHLQVEAMKQRHGERYNFAS